MTVVKHHSQRLTKHRLCRLGQEQHWLYDRTKVEVLPDRVGNGSGGEIFRAKVNGQPCVVKAVHENMSERKSFAEKDLENEINFLSKLQHTHIVAFMGAFVSPNDTLCLLLEFCPAGNLEEKLCNLSNRGSKLSCSTALDYMFQLSQAILFLHSFEPKIVHRDLKPANIIFSNPQTLKLADFGLAKHLQAKNDTEEYVMTGETGSYRFMAPEVFQHEKYDEKVDVYSFAVISYWLLTGSKPFSDVIPAKNIPTLVLSGKRRLDESRIKNVVLKDMLKRCWSLDSSERLSFDEIVPLVETVKTQLKTSMFCI